jgi:N-acetylglutamate synthase-like GNAT family acetyltransferase
LQVRFAEAADIEAIVAVINVAFAEAESFFIERDRVDREAVRSFLHKGKFLVVDDQGAIPGCIYVEVRGERAYLGLLSVDPQRQKSGLGSTLMRAAEGFGERAGCKFMDLRIVNLRTENQDFYRRHGYVETGTQPFPADLRTKLPCHFVNMSKPLA